MNECQAFANGKFQIHFNASFLISMSIHFDGKKILQRDKWIHFHSINIEKMHFKLIKGAILQKCKIIRVMFSPRETSHTFMHPMQNNKLHC